jgi:hypothetical protein
LLDNVVQHSQALNMSLNAKKSVSMVFPPYDRSKMVMASFLSLVVDKELLQFVPKFKYLDI